MNAIKGTILTLVMVGVALALAGINIYYQRSLTRRTQQLWGNDVSLLVAAAPHAELLQLGPATEATDDSDSVSIDGVARPIIGRRVMAVDESSSPGFLNLRHSLRQNASYDWDANRPSTPKTWTYALRFSDDEAENRLSVAILVFSDDGRIQRADGQAHGQLIPKIAKGLMKFAAEKFDDCTRHSAK